MAGSRRRLQNRPPLSPSQHPFSSLHGLVGTTALFLLGIILLAISRSLTSDSAKSSTTIYNSPQEIPLSVLESFDAVLVLGGGVPNSLDSPPLYVQRRCDDAAQVVQRHSKIPKKKNANNFRLPILCLSAGTAHMPQLLSSDGLPIWEATSSAAYLMNKHNNILDAKNIFVETTSYDTLGNAFFARTSHTDHNGWRRLLIVTSQFHMARSKAIFDWIFNVDSKGYRLHYLVSPNVGLSPDALQARLDREAISLESFKTKSNEHRSMASVWKFLNTQHYLYTAAKLVQRAATSANSKQSNESVGDLVRKSYGA